MIGVDTNVLVRLIVGDDRQQVKAAEDYLDKHCTPEQPGFISLMVLCELVWTLDRIYRLDRADVAKAVAGILGNGVLAVEEHEIAASALLQFQSRGNDFADLLIAFVNRKRGCEITVTFDRKAAKLDGFRLLS